MLAAASGRYRLWCLYGCATIPCTPLWHQTTCFVRTSCSDLLHPCYWGCLGIPTGLHRIDPRIGVSCLLMFLTPTRTLLLVTHALCQGGERP